MSDNYSGDIDVSCGNKLPDDYQKHLDHPLEIPCYEKWSEQLQPSIDELHEMGEYYEHKRPF